MAQAWSRARRIRDADRGGRPDPRRARSRSRATRWPTACADAGVESACGGKGVGASRGDGAGRGRARGRRGGARHELLVAVGRKAAHRGHRPRDRRASSPASYLDVDDRLRVGGRDWLYAIGDVNGRALLTHMGKYQARIAGDHILGRDVAATAEAAALPASSSRARRWRPSARRSAAVEAGLDARAVDVETSGPPARASRAGRSRDRHGSSSTRPRGSSSARRSSVRRRPTSCTRRRSPSTGEVPLDRLWHAVPAFPPGARSG